MGQNKKKMIAIRFRRIAVNCFLGCKRVSLSPWKNQRIYLEHIQATGLFFLTISHIVLKFLFEFSFFVTSSLVRRGEGAEKEGKKRKLARNDCKCLTFKQCSNYTRQLLRRHENLLFTHKNGDFGSSFVTERRSAAPISQLESSACYSVQCEQSLIQQSLSLNTVTTTNIQIQPGIKARLPLINL